MKCRFCKQEIYLGGEQWYSRGGKVFTHGILRGEPSGGLCPSRDAGIAVGIAGYGYHEPLTETDMIKEILQAYEDN